MHYYTLPMWCLSGHPLSQLLGGAAGNPPVDSKNCRLQLHLEAVKRGAQIGFTVHSLSVTKSLIEPRSCDDPRDAPKSRDVLMSP